MRFVLYCLCLAVMFGLLVYMNLGPLSLIAAEAQGMAAFDLRANGYSEAEARAFLTALSPEGRAVYLGLQHQLDTVYPPLLALVLGWTFFALMSRPWAVAASVAAVLGAMVDLVENARVSVILQAPSPSAEQIAAASQATVAKTLIVTVALAVLAVSLAKAGLRWLRTR